MDDKGNIKVTIGDITFNGPPDKVAEAISGAIDKLNTKREDPYNNSVYYKGRKIDRMTNTELRMSMIEILEGYLVKARATLSLGNLMKIEWPVDSYKSIGTEISKRAIRGVMDWNF